MLRALGVSFLIALAAVLALGVIVVARRTRRRVALAAWYDAARALGATLQRDGDPRIYGVISGHRVSIRRLSDRRLDDEFPYTFYHVTFARPLPVDLELERTRGREGAADVVSFGDPDFDTAVRIACDDELAAQRFLTTERRTAVRTLIEELDGCRIDRHGIVWRHDGMASRGARIEHVVHLMVRGADVLTGGR